MSNLIRSAKSGSDWTTADLDAYNITLVAESVVNFFGTQSLPQPRVDPEILQVQDAQNMVSDRNAELVNLLDLAMVPSEEESAVNDFAVELFKALGYVRRNRIARTHKDIPFLICGEWRHAKADVCLLDRDQNNILLLVQEDKRFGQGENATTDAQAQLVAEAIGTFSYNNRRRTEAGLDILDTDVGHLSRCVTLADVYPEPGRSRYYHDGNNADFLQNSRDITTRIQRTSWFVPFLTYESGYASTYRAPTESSLE